MKRKTDKDDYGLQTEFERIVREHKAAIYTVCYMFSDDNATVADMFQEVLINIRNGLENFQGRSSAGTWIWRVSLNTCISYEKKLRLNSECCRESTLPATACWNAAENWRHTRRTS